jgi:competence protein ComEA
LPGFGGVVECGAMRILHLFVVMVVAIGFVMAQGVGQEQGESERAAKTSATVDIKRETEEELKAIPGIWEAYSAKIVHGRPYQRKDEPAQRGILPERVYEKVKDWIVARQK